MKTTALFLALSLSIGLMGCGTESDHPSSSDDSGAVGKMDDPFSELRKDHQWPDAPEGKLFLVSTSCKTNIYFYESKDEQHISWFGFWNKNDAMVYSYIKDSKYGSTEYVSKSTKPGEMEGSPYLEREGMPEKGRDVYIESLKRDITNGKALPCEVGHVYLPR